MGHVLIIVTSRAKKNKKKTIEILFMGGGFVKFVGFLYFYGR